MYLVCQYIYYLHLRHVALSDTAEELEKEVKILKEEDILKLEQSKKSRSRMEETWVPEHKTIFLLDNN